jgi:mono/diheme cytochrome c family protein/plastocyanin
MAARRMKQETLARGILIVLAVSAIGAPLVVRCMQTGRANAATVELHARMPDAPRGGWSMDVIDATVGKPLHLRLTSDDVIHGFAVGQTDWPALDIRPGEVVTTDLLFEKPGRYTFYCTRWCGPNHWRMRGIIEVQDPSDASGAASLPTSEPPLYQKLGLDIDATPQLSPKAERSLNELKGLPSAERGAALHVELPAELRQRDWLNTYTPAEAYTVLRNDSAYSHLLDLQIWDVVAFAWRSATTDAASARGAQLYARDCVACHGETGRGDGPAGRDLPGLQAMATDAIRTDVKRGPADLTNLSRLAGLSDVQLQGKLLRGGMGTGMPEFGSLYSDDDQWAVIAFMREFTADSTRK